MNLKGLTVKEYLDKLAGGSATPGGGSASALAGALSASLCAMVARLTLGKEKYRGVWEDMKALQNSADSLSSHFLELAEQDSAAYDEVLAAYRVPKEDEARRREAIQAALKGATAVPIETLRSAARLVDHIDTAIRKGNPNCLTDAAVSALLIRAAAAGAAYNVRTNLSGIEDQDYKSRLGAETSDLLGRVERALEKLEGIVEVRIG